MAAYGLGRAPYPGFGGYSGECVLFVRLGGTRSLFTRLRLKMREEIQQKPKKSSKAAATVSLIPPLVKSGLLNFMSGGLVFLFLLLLLLHRPSIASTTSQWSLPDQNSKLRCRLFPAGYQLQSDDRTGPHRARTASTG